MSFSIIEGDAGLLSRVKLSQPGFIDTTELLSSNVLALEGCPRQRDLGVTSSPL